MTNVTQKTSKLNELSITEAAKGLRSKEFTVRELWDACATAAQDRNEELNAFLELFDADDTAIDAAQERIDAGDAPVLCGIPLAIKDNILIEGHIASAASKILEGYKAVYDATAIKKLREDNALFVGRTNMDEFGMGASTEHSAYGPTKNPHDTSRVPGGSSGGSAAAVAAHMALGAYGTDTGGSCRQPAAHCGVVGFKPTYGSISRYGLIALGSSLDQLGELGKSVADVKTLFESARGHDPMDATTFPEGFYPAPKVQEHLTIGVPRHLLMEGVDEDVLTTFESMLKHLQELGHKVVDIKLPTSAYSLPSYYIIMPAEAATNLARYDGMRYGPAARGKTLLDDYLLSRTEGFGEEAQRRILLGTFVLSSGYIDAYYRKAEAARPILRAEYADAFKACDVVAFPTAPSPAFKFGGKSDPVAMYLEDIFTVTANLTGMPAISIPMGNVDRDGSSLPTGIHFTAPHAGEEVLFKIGADVTGETLN